jgi:hypothetical protein
VVVAEVVAVAGQQVQQLVDLVVEVATAKLVDQQGTLVGIHQQKEILEEVGPKLVLIILLAAAAAQAAQVEQQLLQLAVLAVLGLFHLLLGHLSLTLAEVEVEHKLVVLLVLLDLEEVALEDLMLPVLLERQTLVVEAGVMVAHQLLAEQVVQVLLSYAYLQFTQLHSQVD